MRSRLRRRFARGNACRDAASILVAGSSSSQPWAMPGACDRRLAANPIYREVIPRALTWVQQISMHQPTEWYTRDDGALDVPKLMAAWQAFWREDRIPR